MKKAYLLILLSVSFFTTTSAQFWTPCFGPSGSITGLAVNLQNDVFAGTWGYGIMRSADSGATWNSINNGLTDLFIYSVYSDKNGILYTTGYDGIFRSDDNGNTWVAKNNGLLNPITGCLGFSDAGTIYAANALGLYQSSDGGENWTQITTFENTPENAIYSIAVNAAGYVYIGTDGSGLYFSTDDGNTWQQRDIGNNESIHCIYVENDGTMLATSCFNGSETGSGIFRSADEGNSWEPVNSGLTETAVLSVIQFNGQELFCGTYHNGIFHSTDNGDNWVPWNDGLGVLKNISCFAQSHNGYVYAGTNNGVYRSIQMFSGTAEITAPRINCLNQNVPNPFSDITTITYTVPAGYGSKVNVRLEVYDLSGRRVARLVNESQPPGEYAITWKCMPSLGLGTYLCEMKLNNFSQSIKMVHTQ